MSRRPISLKRLDFMEFVPDGPIAPDRQMEGLWYQLEASGELPIALIPVPGVAGGDVLDLGGRLATVGSAASQRRVVLVDLTNILTGETDGALSDLRRVLAWSPKGIGVLSSPILEPSAIPLMRAFERIMLITQIGVTNVASLQATVNVVGDERIVGSVALNRPLKRRSASRRSKRS